MSAIVFMGSVISIQRPVRSTTAPTMNNMASFEAEDSILIIINKLLIIRHEILFHIFIVSTYNYSIVISSG